MDYSKEQWFGVISTLNPNAIVPPDKQWEIQWRRINRWFKRVNQTKIKSETANLYEDDFDILIAFFQNCFHFKDWLQNSKPNLKDEIKKLFKDHIEMRACKDICNGYKHKKIDSPSLDANFAFSREYDHFQKEIDDSKKGIIYKIVFDDENNICKFNIFDLASSCYNLWEEFIRKNCY